MEEYKVEVLVQKKLINELTDTEKKWMDTAIEAAKNAYAPYSNYQVGAIVVFTDNKFVAGNNQENAAYPSGLCAERVALFSAGAHFPDALIEAIVIVAVKEGVIQDKISPCGACRQVLLESEMRNKQPIRILLCGKEEVLFIQSAAALLPLAFGTINL